MKKPLLLAAALLTSLCFAGLARAEAPVTPATTTAAAVPAPAHSAQSNKMKVCAQQYHQQNIPKAQYHTFMSSCLKKDGGSAATPAAAPATPPAPPSGVTPASTSAPEATGQTSRQEKMKSCNADAKTQNLTGSARKTFMKSCLSK